MPASTSRGQRRGVTRRVWARRAVAALALACVTHAHAGATVDAAIAALRQRAIDTHSDALHIVHNERVLLDVRSGDSADAIELMSVTKSVVALLVGRLVTQGRIASIDQPVSDWYPEWRQGRKAAITLRMLLDHSSGLQNAPDARTEIYPAPDVVQLALAAELDADPGTRFAYNNKAVNLIAGIVRHASGQPMDVYAREALFVPLGIDAAPWTKDKAGNPHGMAGLPLMAADLARIGRLVLARGVWNGEQLIDAAYIDRMLAPSARLDEVGLLWWRRPVWTRFSVDARSFALLEEHAIDATLVAALRPLDGKRFADQAALHAALASALGPAWNERWQRDVVATRGIGPYRAFNADIGPIGAYEANGYLGQYLVVVPSTGLIGVRQIKEREDSAPDDNFAEFTERLLALSAAIEAEAAD